MGYSPRCLPFFCKRSYLQSAAFYPSHDLLKYLWITAWLWPAYFHILAYVGTSGAGMLFFQPGVTYQVSTSDTSYSGPNHPARPLTFRSCLLPSDQHRLSFNSPACSLPLCCPGSVTKRCSQICRAPLTLCFLDARSSLFRFLVPRDHVHVRLPLNKNKVFEGVGNRRHRHDHKRNRPQRRTGEPDGVDDEHLRVGDQERNRVFRREACALLAPVEIDQDVHGVQRFYPACCFPGYPRAGECSSKVNTGNNFCLKKWRQVLWQGALNILIDRGRKCPRGSVALFHPFTPLVLVGVVAITHIHIIYNLCILICCHFCGYAVVCTYYRQRWSVLWT